MHFLRQVTVTLLAMSFWLTGTALAQRQPFPGRLRGLPLAAPPLSGSGEVVALRPGYLQVKAAGDQMWLMKIEARPEKIEVHATAVAGWLRPRMFVRFSATLDKKGMAQTPIEELFVFTPTPRDRIGVFPDSGPLLGEPEQTPANSKRPRHTLTEGRYLVAGQLTGIRGDQIRVVAAGQTIGARLAEKANIRVDVLGDYSLVRQGDKVDYIGRVFDRGKALVYEVKFTAASPFGSEPVPAASSGPKKGRASRQEEPAQGRPGKSGEAAGAPQAGGSVAHDNPAVGSQPAKTPR